MTLKELNQYRFLREEIRDLNCRIREIENKAISISSTLQETPSAKRHADRVGELSAEAEKVRSILCERKRQSEEQLTRTHRYIAECSDPLIRRILICRFIDGLSWRAVSQKVGSNSEDSCRIIAYRYIKNAKN